MSGHSLLLQDLEPFVDQRLRRRCAIVERQIVHRDALGAELLDLVSRLADANHRADVVLFQLLQNGPNVGMKNNVVS